MIASPPVELQPRHDWALFIDVDGTLLEIAPTPMAVVVPAELPSVLVAASQALDGALALLSGRPLADLDRLFGVLPIVAVGQHGTELRIGDQVTVPPPSPAIAAARAQLQDFADRHPGVLIEDKGGSMTAHYRLAPTAEEPLRALVKSMLEKHLSEFELLESKMAFDIRPLGHHKGRAVDELMRRRPFAGRVPVMVGDDATDEDGFRAVHQLGGIAVAVGPRQPSVVVEHHFESPARFRSWLASMPLAIRS